MDTEGWNVRYNQLNLFSLEAFANVRGGFHQNCKDVYFMRALGADKEYREQIEEMDRILSKNSRSGRGSYIRMEQLPVLTSPEDSRWYGDCYEQFCAENGQRAVSRKVQGKELWQRRLGKACGQVLEIFRKLRGNTTASIERSFVAKLLFWFDHAGLPEPDAWPPEQSVKFVISNISKTQEYLFCYLLTLLGADVLLLQNREDISKELAELGLSGTFVLGNFQEVKVPACGGDFQSKPEAEAAAVHPVPVCIRRPEREKTVSVSRKNRAPDRRELEFEELALLASSVVMIAVHREDGEIIGTGSGIMIGKEGYILTNYHVASGGSFYSVRIEDDETVYPTDEIIKYNSVLDLAVIRIDRELIPLPVYQGEKKLVRGQKVVAIGSPLGMFNSVSNGIISGFRHFENVDMIQFTAPTSHGSSGGAVLNMYGEVIGISTAGMDNGQNINLAVGYEWIRQFIRGLL